MVFCGKPSKGCKSCRQRRIKCDQIRPACSQCRRSAKTCEGYRDLLNLSFRNENEKVVRKVLLTPESSQTAASRDQQHPTGTRIPKKTTIENLQDVIVQNTKPIGHSLRTYHDDEGVNFFLKTYGVALLDLPTNLRSSPSPSRLMPKFVGNEVLFNTVSSVGFAGLGNVTKDKRYMVLSRKKFSVAANFINHAIKNPGGADLEAVFKAMMLLALFQLVSDPLSSASWSIHLEGCAALAQIMEMKRSRDVPVRHQLKLCLQMFVENITQKRLCSPNALRWYKTCAESIDPDGTPAVSFGQILIKYTIFNASMSEDVSVNSSDFIKKAVAIDDELALWAKQLPESWSYKVHPNSTTDSASRRKDHAVRHLDPWMTRIWNDYRWARISINESIIHRSFNQEFILIGDATQLRKSLQINSKMAKGLSESLSSDINQRQNRARDDNQKYPVRVNGSFSILYPLAVVAQATGVSEEIHQFAVSKLTFLGSAKGIHQASNLVEAAIKKRQKWNVLLADWVKPEPSDDETGLQERDLAVDFFP